MLITILHTLANDSLVDGGAVHLAHTKDRNRERNMEEESDEERNVQRARKTVRYLRQSGRHCDREKAEGKRKGSLKVS